MDYYYLIASLPMLKLGEENKISIEKFIEQCGDNLSPYLLEQLKEVTLMPRENHCCISEKKWSAYETSLRNCIVHWVSYKNKDDPALYTREEKDAFTSLNKQIEDAFDSATPADTEMIIDKMRWTELDNISTGNDFNFEALFIYKIKLLLVEKWVSLTKESGQEKVEKTVTGILEKVENTQ